MKTALITGANKGIGYETARQLGKKGFHVIITGRDEGRLKEALGKLEREGASVEMLVMDVVNAVCPGWVRTDMGGSGASRSVEKGAETPVWLASEASSDLSGKFFRDMKQIPW